MKKISRDLPVLLRSDVPHVMTVVEYERLNGKVHLDGGQPSNPNGDWCTDLPVGDGRLVVFG